MNVYPGYLLRPRLIGEGRVYDLLAGIADAASFAVHSVNLPEHEYKRWGEADFVVVGPRGITLLEVKGGTVTLAGREWRYENGRGQFIRSTEGPARQAMSAAIALEKMLGERLGRRVRCRWGVVFPLCSFRTELLELPPSRLADMASCEDPVTFSKWLDSVPSDQHSASTFSLKREEIAEIRGLLLPELTATTSLQLAVQAAHAQVIQLTTQQFAILESLASNARITLCGGAGTGKTELASLCARADVQAGRRPAIVTSECAASAALRTRMTAHGVPVVCDRLPAGTDTLIIDEGQDFAHTDRMKSLFEQLPGGLREGRWRWFMDPNLQFTERPPDPACIRELQRHSANVTLTRNVRSTREIVGAIRALLAADVGISEIDGFGIKVQFHTVDSIQEQISCASRIVNSLLEEGIHPSEIAILGAADGEGTALKGVASKYPNVLKHGSGDAFSGDTWRGAATSIRSFRGLEARAVILTDLDEIAESSAGEAELYIGMSRASAVLHLLVTAKFQDYLSALALRTGHGVPN